VEKELPIDRKPDEILVFFVRRETSRVEWGRELFGGSMITHKKNRGELFSLCSVSRRLPQRPSAD
jgi:hypothetical protein